MFLRNELPASDWFLAYVRAFCSGPIVMMAMGMKAMVMMAMVMVLVLVILVPEALWQVGGLRQR